MPIKLIEPRRLYLEIADQIRSLIKNGELPALSRLPAERELAEQFNVSRPSVREALIALELEGYVDIRPGSGVFVTMPKNPAPDYSRSEGPLEVIRARSLIEGEIVAEAARRMKLKDIAALKQILLEMEGREADKTPCISADREFHLYIAKKADNDVLARIVTELFDQRNSLLATRFGAHFDNPKTWVAVLSEHRKILAALTARDPEKARRAMRYHLRAAHDRWALQLEDAKKIQFNGRRRRSSKGADVLSRVP
jgi:GntR family transcriptional regulator, transcriptional repressor for pyruvate dehydrogenase complex